MRIAIDFENAAEAYPVLQFLAGVNAPIGRAQLQPAPTAPAEITTETVFVPGPEKPKRGRKPKLVEPEPVASVPDVAAQATEFDDVPAAAAPDFLDDDAPAPAVELTKDDVRASLVGYQERLVASGKDVEAARTTVLALLKKVSGADKLGACPEDKFAAVIEAAKTAK